MRLALWELSNVILKLGFRRAFDGTVNMVKGDSENRCALNCHVLAFCFRGNEKVCSSSSGCNAQFHLFDKGTVRPDIHIYQ